MKFFGKLFGTVTRFLSSMTRKEREIARLKAEAKSKARKEKRGEEMKLSQKINLLLQRRTNRFGIADRAKLQRKPDVKKTKETSSPVPVPAPTEVPEATKSEEIEAKE